MTTAAIEGYGLRFTEYTDEDRGYLQAVGDGLFDVDNDPRPLPVGAEGGAFTIRRDDVPEPLGAVSWVAMLHGPSYPCLAYNIGIVLAPAARGRGIGTAAQRLLLEYLFAYTDVYRIEASTDVDNLAEQRCLERIGMCREGVLRGAQLRAGIRRDVVLYAVLREDPAITGE
ncbi:GNAT family N-acetyltransferase [Sciscionella sediminilitoris]|uniref:GNAT family N-acetyltransferase n=1 Tax=Sciscionella sediminilitoris TaxID=1445613 RepID=UPI00068CC6D4|nr:GNAT family protein [Sciscionella sp. SE31]